MHKSKDQKRYEAIVRQLKFLKSYKHTTGFEIRQSQVTSIYQTLALFDITNFSNDSQLETKITNLCKKLTGRVKT